MAQKPRKRYWWLLLMVAVSLVCVLVVYRGAANLSRVQEELRQSRSTNQRLDTENRALYRQVRRLRGDKAALEKAARREMGLVGEDEVVYQKSGPAKKSGKK
jgi:cell division protein FtsB